MKTVTAICVYDSVINTIYNLSFIHGENIIPIVYAGSGKRPSFNYLIEIQRHILNVAKDNNMRVKCYDISPNVIMYDIKYINISNPGLINRYYVSKSEG